MNINVINTACHNKKENKKKKQVKNYICLHAQTFF